VIAADRIGRVAVRPGDRVLLATFAANRALGPFDPATNAAAALKQLWFGAGSHFCLGAPLALAQIRLVVDTILRAVPSGEISVVSRKPARGVLIPSYSTATISRTVTVAAA
jgi:cytochrome P450